MVNRKTVISDVASLWTIEADQKLHQGCFSRTRGPDESDRLSERACEGNAVESLRCSGLMLKDNVFEFDPAQTWQADRMLRLGLLRRVQNVLKVLQRDLRL